MIKNLSIKISLGLIALLVIVSVIVHFYKIDTIPYGYHVDELAGSVTVECLATEGVDAHNNAYPLFSQTNYGTPKPPTYVYPAVLWGKIFGYTVPGLRCLSVVVHLVGLMGLFFLARLLMGNTFAVWVLFAAVVSPWTWCFSRVAFESLFALTFIIWGLYFFFRRQNYGHWVLAGLLFSLAMYSYPPMRLQVPLMFVSLWVYSLRRMTVSKPLWGVLVGSLVLPITPLVSQMFNNIEVQRRFNMISIAAPEFLKSIGKTNSWSDLVGIFVSNYQLHLTPDFLIFKGDPSLIHSTGHVGILSWLDMFALGLCFLSLMMLMIKPMRSKSPWLGNSSFLVLLLVNIFLGIVPSAITNSELPNSLRIVGSWPFMCLLTGFFLYQLQLRFWQLGLPLVMVGVLFFCAFTKVYFGVYQEESKGMFSYWTLDQAKAAKTDEDWMKFMLIYHGQDYHFRYFLMQYRSDTCTSTRLKWEKQNEILQRLHLNI